MEPQSCASLAVEVVSKGYLFVSSREGQTILAILAGMKAVILYCGRSPLQDANKLACTMSASLVVAVVIVGAGLKVPQSIKVAMACKTSTHAVAAIHSGRSPVPVSASLPKGVQAAL